MDNQFGELILVGGYCYERTLLLRARHILYMCSTHLLHLLDTCFIPAVQHSNYGHA